MHLKERSILVKSDCLPFQRENSLSEIDFHACYKKSVLNSLNLIGRKSSPVI